MKLKATLFIILALIASVGMTSTASATNEANIVKYCGEWHHYMFVTDGEDGFNEIQRRVCNEEVIVEHGVYPWNWYTTEVVTTFEFQTIYN